MTILGRGLKYAAGSVIIHTMNARYSKSPISDLLRRTIVESGVSYNTLQRETRVTRASIMRFVRGSQSLRLDRADRLAEYFGLELRKRG
jgi:plasmid maintenance system antidote protein VapI